MRALILEWWPALLLCCWVIVSAISWMGRDDVAPSFDQSHYLDVSWSYVKAVDFQGFAYFLTTALQEDPGRAPLYPILLSPLLALFGPSVDSALILNLLLIPILILFVASVARQLFGHKAIFTAALVAAITPLVIGLSHEVLPDFLLTTLTVIAVDLALRSQNYSNTSMCVTLGSVLGLGLLTKISFPLFVAGPLIMAGTQRLTKCSDRGKEEKVSGGEKRIMNVLLCLAIAGVLAALWYVPNAKATLDYLESTTTGDLTIGAGPDNPLAFRSIAAFSLGLINSHLSWTIVIGVVLAACALAVEMMRKGRDGINLAGISACLTWFLIPFLAIGFSKNQDVRLMAPAFPGIAVLSGGLISNLRQKVLRGAIFWLIVIGGAAQTALLLLPLDKPSSLLNISIKTSVGHVYIPLSGQPQGYNRLPTSVNYAKPVVRYLAERARSYRFPPQVGVLQIDDALNVNSLSFQANAEGIRVKFHDQPLLQANTEADLERTLLTYDFVLYIPSRPLKRAEDRLTILSRKDPARRITPEMLLHFEGPAKSLSAGRGRRVFILERRASGRPIRGTGS